MPEVPTPDNRDHQVSRAKGVGLRGGAPVETMVVVLLAVAHARPAAVILSRSAELDEQTRRRGGS